MGEIRHEWVNGVLTRTIDTRTLAETKAVKKADNAEWRYNREIDGITWNGWAVKTDRDSQRALDAEYLATMTNHRVDGDPFTFGDGVARALTVAQYQAMALAVRSYVQACRRRQGVIDAAIDAAATNAAVDAIDYTSGYPSQVYAP